MFFVLLLLAQPGFAQSPDPVESSGSSDSQEYEVDYEEEPKEEPKEEIPVQKVPIKKSSKKTITENPVEGSRAEKKIAPLMGSDSKSKYKKNGKPLDVDTD